MWSISSSTRLTPPNYSNSLTELFYTPDSKASDFSFLPTPSKYPSSFWESATNITPDSDVTDFISSVTPQIVESSTQAGKSLDLINTFITP